MTPSVARVLEAIAVLYDRQSSPSDAERARREAEHLLGELRSRRSVPTRTVEPSLKAPSTPIPARLPGTRSG